MSAELSHKKLWLRVTDFNMKLDKRLRKVLKIETPLTLDWCLHDEGLSKRNKSFSLHKTMNFPPQLPEGYDEPIIGLGCGRFLEQERVLEKIKQTLELDRIEADLDSNCSSPDSSVVFAAASNPNPNQNASPNDSEKEMIDDVIDNIELKIPDDFFNSPI